MKKKKLKKSTEKAFKVVTVLKENADILSEKGNDTTFIIELETSVRKLDELEKELVTLKETLIDKKCIFKQEKELMLELFKNAEKVIKKEVGKNRNPEQKKQPKTSKVKQVVVKQEEEPQKSEQKRQEKTKVKQEEVKQEEEKQNPVKQQKAVRKPKTETTEETNPEVAEKADEPK